MSDATSAVWDGGALVCRAVRHETHDVRSFVFAAPDGAPFDFLPGQFLTLSLPNGIQRCYTIASPPSRPRTVSITSKRVPGGPGSGWLHDHLRPGMTIEVAPPLGDFVLPRARRLLLLSGGSGVTPLMSMVRFLFDMAEPCDVIFIHSARSPADIIFRDELAMMARRMPGLRVSHVCETNDALESWPGLAGRLDRAKLDVLAPDFMQRDILTCGPAPYMAAVRATLGEAGFDFSRYHDESFSFDSQAVTPSQPAEGAPATDGFRVDFSQSQQTVLCTADMTILEAAQRAGMVLPSSCTRGVCGTCKSRLVSGEVDMKHGGGIRPREIAAGLILICCARPRGNVVIER